MQKIIYRKTKKTGLVLAMLGMFVLSGCSEIQLVSHYAKKMPWPGKSSAKSHGDYKVGSAYKINGVKYYPREDFTLVQKGIASWYGPGFHGKKTANGEIYDQFELTAAHKTLQMPALVRVTNLKNGRSIVVRINDRGPYAHGRIIDLSRRGAELLGFKNSGTAPVKIEVLEKESRAIAAAARSGQDITHFASNRPVPSSVPRNISPQRNTSYPPNGYNGYPSQQHDIAVLKNDAEAMPLPESLQPVTRTQAEINQPISLQGNAVDPVGSVEGVRLSSPTLTSKNVSNEGSFLSELDFLKDTPVKGHSSAQGEFMPDPVVTEKPVINQINLYVQAGAFSIQDNAEKLSAHLSGIAPTQVSSIMVKDTMFHRVRLGPLSSVEQADTILARVIEEGHTAARIIID